MDDGDRKLFFESLQRATEQCTGPELDQALHELGWSDALEDDSRDAVSILFELQGTQNVTSGALDVVIARSLGVDATTTGTVLPRIGRHDPPGAISAGRLIVSGVASRNLENLANVAIVLGGVDTGVIIVDRARLALRTVPGLDPALGLIEVSADLPTTDASRIPVRWDRALAAGQLALSHELVGASRAMLRLAREHAVERIQFGRPISGFQAIRHRLAESLVAIEAAQASAEAAWDDPTPLAAALAKAIAGASARTVARHAQQVLAGMGYTTEHPLHLYLRRSIVLDQLLGAGRTLTSEIGEQLLATKRLPQMLPL